MGIYALKPGFRRLLAPLARAMPNVNPDALSGLAVLVAMVAAGALALAPRRDWLYLAAVPLFFVRLALNALDGMVAQAQSTASPRGEIVNEFSDRVADLFIFGAIVVGGAADPRLAAAALAITLLVSYAGTLSKAIGARRNYAGPLGKADRMAFLAITCVIAYAAPRFWSGVTASAVFNVMSALFVLLGIVSIANRLRAAANEVAPS